MYLVKMQIFFFFSKFMTMENKFNINMFHDVFWGKICEQWFLPSINHNKSIYGVADIFHIILCSFKKLARTYSESEWIYVLCNLFFFSRFSFNCFYFFDSYSYLEHISPFFFKFPLFIFLKNLFFCFILHIFAFFNFF